MISKRILLLAVLLMSCTAASPTGHAAENIKIAAMRLGTSWYVFGATLYQLLQDNLPPDTRVQVLPQGGGIANPIAVNSGKASIGLANVATAVWAYNGSAEVYRGRKQTNIRALVGGLNSVWFSSMVREDYISKTGNDTLEKILLGDDPVRIVMKPKTSTVPAAADMVLAALGTDRKAIQSKGGKIIQVDAKQIPSILRDGRADLYFESMPLVHPTVTEVTLTGNIRFLDLPDKAITALSKKGLKPRPMPQAYNGQSGETKSVDFGTLIIANKSLSEEMAYLITKTICENKDAMAKAHKAWSNFKPELAGTPENTGIPLHPGALRYYRERGWR